jgi:hypothetical protein
VAAIWLPSLSLPVFMSRTSTGLPADAFPTATGPLFSTGDFPEAYETAATRPAAASTISAG